MKTAGLLWSEAATGLRRANVENPLLDARVLLAHVLGLDLTQLVARSGEIVADDARARYAGYVARRAAGEPVARILGAKEFWSQNFLLSPETLVPRPETETVVEAALAAKPERSAPLRILDLGTGSGVLLGALLLERPNASGVGVDLDPEAARTARSNLAALGVLGRAPIVCGNWADSIKRRFDLVVSNPPYVATHQLFGLPVEVRVHDPRRALDGGADGLDSYRAIIAELPRLLAPGGVAVLELGVGQEQAVAEIARHAQIRVNGPARRDLWKQPRALVLGPSASPLG